MRVAHGREYTEVRDAIARDWCRFLAFAVPDALWLPLPNLGPDIVDYAYRWQLDRFLLTGGDDIDRTPDRDQTEAAILSFAADRHLPVFGVCRGLQFIHRFLGGTLRPCPVHKHVATTHPVILAPDGNVRVVNSFHTAGIHEADPLAGALPTARTPDGWIEGIRWTALDFTAVMWHPERHTPFHPADRALVRDALRIP